ncbi:MarR family winged helix-turn-helix transcriptional regulator [Arthrobacter halodurans]|uniref:MarR family winged helix-turn-helix transcriptional regulator n=1 Tax=Arthrobacter halodurans TaxID=516699 RepID=A0ABV4UM47_9MICC
MVEPDPEQPTDTRPDGETGHGATPRPDVETGDGAAPPPGSGADSSPPGDLASELRIAIMRTSRRLRIEASGDILSPGQYSVLVGLSSGPRTLGQLAAREGVQAPSMTRIVKALEDKGLATRAGHPDDARLVLLSISDAGAATLDRARRERTAWLSRRVDELPAADRAVLERAAELLQGMSAR